MSDQIKYEAARVTCHYLDSDPELHRAFCARDNSVMTPWGALICHMQLKCRRADYVIVTRFYQDNNIPIWKFATAGHFEGGDFVILEPGTVIIGYCEERSEQAGSEQVATFVREKGWVIDWLRKKDFEFVDVDFAEAKNLGVNLVALGNKKVLSMSGSVRLNEKMRALGYEVFAPDMSMFTLGGDGVHCLCQAGCCLAAQLTLNEQEHAEPANIEAGCNVLHKRNADFGKPMKSVSMCA